MSFGAILSYVFISASDNVYYRKLHGKAGDVHPVWYHGKAVCVRQGVTSNKEFKEVKEIKKKTNDCTLSRADAEYSRSCAGAEIYV